MQVLVSSKKTALEHYQEDHDSPEQHLGQEQYQQVLEGHQNHHQSLDELEALLDAEGVEYDTCHSDAIEEPSSYDAVISLGGDGTLLSTAAHLEDTPALPLRSDPNSRGELCTYGPGELDQAVDDLVEETYQLEEWTRLEGDTGDHRELALNDVYVGGETSMDVASYQLEHEGATARHANSGLVVSTGAGSTGWYANITGDERFERDADEARWVVREPIDDQDLHQGRLKAGDELVLTAEMNPAGVVSYDCDTDEHMHELPRGTELTIRVAETPLQVIAPGT